MDDRRMRRAGLDYHEMANVHLHPCLEDCLSKIESTRLFTLSTKGLRTYSSQKFCPGDAFLFGSETSGLPAVIREAVPRERQLRIPMQPNNRSLNLANSVAILVYEAWRQVGFPGADGC